jgi:putative addiction module component (TIGR02574 family)
MTKQDLAKRALELPAEERVELGEILVSSVLPPLTEAGKAEIARRSRELQENPHLALSEEEFWSEVDRLATA